MAERTPSVLGPSIWQQLYLSDLQSVYAPIAVPILFLIYRLTVGRRGGGLLPAAARFVDTYAVAFAVLTIIDPIATGPMLRLLGIGDGPAGTVVVVIFVLLGDFRVYLLLFGMLAIAAGRSWQSMLGRAAAWTLVVPMLAYPTNTLLHLFIEGLDTNSIWLIYELMFTAVALLLRQWLATSTGLEPELRGYLLAALRYVTLYYGLWATADILIQLAHLEVGWALRILPNQLYYAFWIPFVFFRFFSTQSGGAGVPPRRTVDGRAA